MNPNKLTPGHNVMWESSRMMLPQHKDAIRTYDRESVLRVRPELTEEEREEMFGRLAVSRANTLNVTIAVFNAYGEDRIINGIVTGLDPRYKLVKIEVGYDWELVEFENVVRVDIDYGEA